MIRNVRISGETEKAYLFTFVSGKNQMWVPKSCVLSMEEEPLTRTYRTNIMQVDIKDSFYNQNYKYDRKKAKKEK